MSEQDAAEEATTSDDGDADVDGEVDIEDAPEGVDTGEIDLEDVAGETDEDLVERVAESDPEEIARELAALRSQNESLESEVEELESEAEELEEKLKRKQAEFQNYKKRMKKRREEEQQRATEDLVSRILDVRDNLERALEQDEDTDIRGGVESTLRQLDDVLDAENVDVIDPDPGEDVDPSVHQVLANVESEEEPGAIADVHRPGYEMAEKVLREAQVTVSKEE
ncbi:nucleotide exchange factor GrpE [Haloarcula salinisoli]|uniref:Protein GrpE n=1 Tax=Haloarcula salinisoli TaxID=2487746 RepID=A0A8J7YBK6_9EURY|nr:nucleotide exchange factor GrpE [Halomicroarcula salinisoli]MBX0285990.1 nucleotide exchange factor GrpE [Halomicroarcula salinisoli]MBX0302522.1 nucleotide exchange factor GrpE [Halomicroarcula salinisoli]